MDCLKMQEAAEHNMKSMCQHYSFQAFLGGSVRGQQTLSSVCFYILISSNFDFLPHLLLLLLPVLFLPPSSPPVHPMWQGPLAVPGGDRQSPIDIVVRKSVFDSELKPLVTNYDPQTCQQIWNNGYSFLVEYDDTTDKSSKYS